jgi:hypothetical protein
MGKNLHHINLASNRFPTYVILTYIQLSIAELNWASSSSNLFPRVKGSKIHGVSWTWRMACFFHTFCGYFRFTQAEQQHSSKLVFCCISFLLSENEIPWKCFEVGKAHIFWEGHKFLRNLHFRFVLCSNSQIYGGDFAKFYGPLGIYELYPVLASKKRGQFKKL